MKKLSIALIVITISIFAAAQKKEVHSERKNDKQEQRHNRFKKSGNFKSLNLTEAQKSEMKSINESFRQQMKDLKKQGNITVNEKKQKREALLKDRKDKIAAVLTTEQRSQAANSIKEYRQNWKKGDRETKIEDVRRDLHLTPEQTAKLSAINTKFRSNLQTLRKNTALTKEEKREQMLSLVKQHRSEVELLLTNDQKQQMKSQQKYRRNRTAVK